MKRRHIFIPSRVSVGCESKQSSDGMISLEEKPFRDWTAGEIQEYCKLVGDDCEGCRIERWCDEMTLGKKVIPCRWDLEDVL